MQAEIPDFILELSKQLNAQPSRSTAHPFYQVRCKRLYVTEEGYNSELFVVQDAEGEVWRYGDDDSKLAEYLFDNYADWLFDLFGDDSINLTVDYIIDNYDFNCDDLPDDCKKLWMQEIEEVVSTHLTLDAAEQFIKRKQHDYPKLFTYAESAYWSPQLRQLQDWLKQLTQPA